MDESGLGWGMSLRIVEYQLKGLNQLPPDTASTGQGLLHISHWPLAENTAQKLLCQ